MLATLASDGRVVNQGTQNLIQAYYNGVLDDFTNRVTALSAQLGTEPRSVYVRGSVAVGRAIEGLSDVDIVVIYDQVSDTQRAAYMDIASEIAQNNKGRVDDIDITVTTLPAVLYDEQIKNLKIYLKHQSVLLLGEDILEYLPAVYPGRNLALYMYGDLEEELQSLKAQFSAEGQPKLYQNQERPNRFWCVWLARTILRSSMALAMNKDPQLTQDLLECQSISVKHYPELREMMQIAADFAIDPTDDAKKCLDFVNVYGDNYVKLWNEQKEIYEKNYN